MRVLIVDDSNIIRRSIQRTIGSGESPYEIRTASNGKDALRVFDEFLPEIVTMDITMPEMDGISCVDAILSRRPETRILVISALADKATAVEAVRRGAQGFLLKPFTPESLSLELTELLKD
ncbi:MAG TPA: response regulator [Candidatus Baltobacteraceae bacterium]|jgi:two-component system chemotaxis response regulator CheY|nr:response regulator [Candidatus Baltobacteraceae bacterium]